jgi:hypothetical protein
MNYEQRFYNTHLLNAALSTAEVKQQYVINTKSLNEPKGSGKMWPWRTIGNICPKEKQNDKSWDCSALSYDTV